MTSVLLIYPYFNPPDNRSIFRFPPLGLAYIAAALREADYDVSILDCTFMSRGDALKKAGTGADVIGIYSMVTMREESIRFAKYLRSRCNLLIAGGPLPSCDPVSFMDDFDIAVKGEGEHAMLEILRAYEGDRDFSSIPGIVYHRRSSGELDGLVFTEHRELETDLDGIAFPARDLLPNNSYIEHWKKGSGMPPLLFSLPGAVLSVVSSAAMRFLIYPTARGRLRTWSTRSSRRSRSDTTRSISRMMYSRSDANGFSGFARR